MRAYIRESRNMGNGMRYIAHYTPEEYLFLSIIKFLFFLTLVWPLQLLLGGTIFMVKWTAKAVLWVVSLPVKLIKMIGRKNN